MRIVEQSYEILTDLSNPIETILKQIERAGRVCYKSENLIKDDSCITFCKNILNRGHEAVIEHSQLSVKFICDRAIANELVRHRIASYCQESSRYCVAGDTQLKYSNCRIKMTVAELYHNKINSKNGSWRRFKIRQIDDNGNLVYNHIDDVFYIGKKPVYNLMTRLGYALKCTADHEIYTSNGYLKLSDLSVGSLIYVNGTTVNDNSLYKSYDWLYHQYITLNKTFNIISSEFGFNISTLKKWANKLNIPKKPLSYFNKGRIPWNNGVSEESDERVKRPCNALRKYHHCGRRHDKILKYDTSEYQKRNTGKCNICGKTDCILDVHHIDENRCNNNPINLITLCRPHHSMLHSKNLDIIALDEVVSIEPCGEADVYDISMNKYHNFIASGVVVHNCNYSKDKFGNEIKVVCPKEFESDNINYNIWYNSCLQAEQAYMALLSNGVKPEFARNVLPLSTATEIIMTANIREWRNVFKLRSSHNPKAHPQMRALCDALLKELKCKIPVLFDDIN